MTTRERVEGRSESLNKTITEVMELLDDNADRPGGWGAKLRPFLHEKLADLAEYWYKRGVHRGHIESHKEFKETACSFVKASVHRYLTTDISTSALIFRYACP